MHDLLRDPIWSFVQTVLALAVAVPSVVKWLKCRRKAKSRHTKRSGKDD